MTTGRFEPAFPCPQDYDYSGMSLRDYMAITAMPIAVTLINQDGIYPHDEVIAARAYAIADAMIEERKV